MASPDQNPLRIAVIGGSDTKGGGATRVAVDLVAALNQAGHRATHLVGLNEEAGVPARRSFYGPRAVQTLAEQAQRQLRRFGLPHLLPLDLPALLTAQLRQRFDLLHFHDLGPGMSPLTIGALSLRMPVAWTFHDCAPFTGGCIYPMDCRRYLTRCGTDGGCPQLGHWPMGELYDFTGTLQEMRRFVHRKGRIMCIAPSAWLADTAFGSGVLPTRPRVILNGIDTIGFTPAPDRAALRQQLGLPHDQPVILLSAARIDDKRKGVGVALDAIKAIPECRPFVLIVGGDDPALASALEGIPHHVTGFIAERAALARWYGAADLHLNCSIAEVQGLVILEAMACATPAVAFASGGIPASIEHGVSGFLVPPMDMPALIEGLRHALAPGIAAAWGEAARQRVETHFSAEAFLEGHLALYAEMLHRQTRMAGT